MADLLQWVGDWAKGAQETVSFLADTKSLFYAASTVTVFAAGLVPRIGPMRALFLGASPLYTRIEAVSQRTAQVTALQELLRNTRGHGFYCVVQGPRGVGKTCLVDTALRWVPGVVLVKVAAGVPQDAIVADALRGVTRASSMFTHNAFAARRVVLCHRLFFRVPPTVVLRASEVNVGEVHAGIAGACRALAEEHKLRVVVDASHNSLAEAAVATKREAVLQVEAMPRELVEALDGLGELHAALKTAGIADVVWAVLGGNPADYFAIWRLWSKSRDVTVVGTYVRDQLATAIDNRVAMIGINKRLELLYSKFVTEDAVPLTVLESMELVRPNPDKVLRKVRRGEDGSMLVPATPAMGVVLRYKLDKPLPIGDLATLLAKGAAPSPTLLAEGAAAAAASAAPSEAPRLA